MTAHTPRFPVGTDGQSCANCHWYLDYPLTHHGGWCNRGQLGVPTAPDFYCNAWEPKEPTT